MIRPNAILVNVGSNDGKRWNVVYIREENGTYSHVGQPYVKSNDPLNLDPFVNWMDFVPDREWVHPVHAKRDKNGGWYLKAFDTYHECRWDGESVSLSKLNESGIVFRLFDKLLDRYKEMTDERLLDELNVGRVNKWTMEELEKMYNEN